MKSTNQTPRSLINSKLKSQVNDDPESQLMFSIVMQAVSDLTLTTPNKGGKVTTPEMNSAISYLFLNSNIPHAELCGLETEYVRDVIYKVFLFLSKSKEHNLSGQINTALSLMTRP